MIIVIESGFHANDDDCHHDERNENNILFSEINAIRW